MRTSCSISAVRSLRSISARTEPPTISSPDIERYHLNLQAPGYAVFFRVASSKTWKSFVFSSSTLAGWPCLKSWNGTKKRNTIARRNGRNTTTSGLNARPPPKRRNARTAKDCFHRFLSDQFRTTARSSSREKISFSMYSCHIGLSE